METFIQTNPVNCTAELLNTKSASALLGVSKSYLDKKRVAGGGPKFFKVGRRVLYDRRDLELWLAGRQYGSTSEVYAS